MSERGKKTLSVKSPTSGSRSRRRKRRRLSPFAHVLIGLLFLLIVGAGAAVCFLKINDIEVRGKTDYTSSQIIAASGLKVGDRIFLSHPLLAQTQIVRKLPGIEEATVSFHIPLGFAIDVKADTPVLAVQCKNGFASIDRKCKVITVAKDAGSFASLPTVSGVSVENPVPGAVLPKKEKDKISQAVNIYNGLRKDKIQKIRSVDVSNTYELSADYDGRVKILIGTPADLNYKLEFAARLLSSKDYIGETEKGLLDVSQSAQNNKVSFIPS